MIPLPISLPKHGGTSSQKWLFEAVAAPPPPSSAGLHQWPSLLSGAGLVLGGLLCLFLGQRAPHWARKDMKTMNVALLRLLWTMWHGQLFIAEFEDCLVGRAGATKLAS